MNVHDGIVTCVLAVCMLSTRIEDLKIHKNDAFMRYSEHLALESPAIVDAEMLKGQQS